MKIWWCQEHGTNSWDERHLFCLLKPGLDDVDDTPCRMVPMRLIPDDPRLASLISMFEDALLALDGETP